MGFHFVFSINLSIPLFCHYVEPLPLAAPPACRSGSENRRNLKKPRAAPSPTPPASAPTTLRNGQRQRSEHNSSSDDDHRNSPDEPV